MGHAHRQRGGMSCVSMCATALAKALVALGPHAGDARFHWCSLALGDSRLTNGLCAGVDCAAAGSPGLADSTVTLTKPQHPTILIALRTHTPRTPP